MHSAGAADPASKCDLQAGRMGRNSVRIQPTPFFPETRRFFAAVSRKSSTIRERIGEKLVRAKEGTPESHD
jgi:hypothetical protein